MILRIGQDAPPFEVKAADGRVLRLADFLGKKNVVLYFYPRDFTTVCTQEACGFRDSYETLAAGDTEVIGVSLDSDDSHRRFIEHHKIPFPLVSDASKTLTRQYGALSTIRSLLGVAKRLTYVIDKRGKIAGAFEGELSAKNHLNGVRDLLKKLGAAPKEPKG